jgi:hypothetical protein
MALVLIKEDGSGKADANAYATVADCDAYHEGHLYADRWTAATQDRKGAALVMATRLIDSQFQFNGFRAHSEQALQWPREKCPDPDEGSWRTASAVLPWANDNWVEPDVVPTPVVHATCEMARELLLVDRTAAPVGEGIDTIQTVHAVKDANGSTTESSSTKYSKSDLRPIISAVAQAMLSKFGGLVSGGSGAVRLIRA